jgi:hypothetical protein
MNTRPTPETDAFFATFADGEYAPSHAEYYARLQDLERERDEAREEIKMLKTNLEISFRQTEQAVQDRAEEHKTITAQRDRLAAVLQRIRDGYGGQVASPNCCEDCDYLLPIDEALQSLTQKP